MKRKVGTGRREKLAEYERSRGVTERKRQHARKRRYGISHEQYEALYEKQGGLCAICRRAHEESFRGRLRVDHDHSSGAVRGLLCDRCNVCIGQMGDTAEAVRAFLLAALPYLESPSTRESHQQ
jgi:hypothetical protein